MTAADVLEAITDGRKRFGTYSYYDKGADSVMDMRAWRENFAALPSREAVQILEGLHNVLSPESELSNKLDPFVLDIVGYLLDLDQEDFNDVIFSSADLVAYS